MSITEFLLARVAEDEGTLPYIVDDHLPVETPTGWLDWRARVQADCEAKRQIVEDFAHLGGIPRGPLAAHAEWACHVIAAIYSDHPDYDPEWRV